MGSCQSGTQHREKAYLSKITEEHKDGRVSEHSEARKPRQFVVGEAWRLLTRYRPAFQFYFLHF